MSRAKDVDEGIGCLLIAVALAIVLWAFKSFT
jgi:hypothetical protein